MAQVEPIRSSQALGAAATAAAAGASPALPQQQQLPQPPAGVDVITSDRL